MVSATRGDGHNTASTSWLSRTVCTYLLLTAGVQADTTKNLASVLAGESSISTYYSLVKQYPEFLLSIPQYSGVTIIVPCDSAFNKSQEWQQLTASNKSAVLDMLNYHILHDSFSTQGMAEGPTIFKQSFLTDSTVANVTGGQRVRLDKQPGNDVIFTSGAGARSELVKDEIPFSAGTVQIVDTLMRAPTRLEKTARDYSDMNGFLGAVYAAGLLDQFADTTDVTIFAPRNAAFQRVAGAMSNLTKDALAQILKYHLVIGQVLPVTSLVNGTTLSSAAYYGNGTAGGAIPLKITRSANNLYVDASQIVQSDVLIANGIIHVISDVLNPGAAAMEPNPTIALQAPAFAATGSSTSTGVRVPTPYITAIPCTSACPVTTSATMNATTTTTRTTATSSVAVKAASSSGRQGAAPPGWGLVAVGVGIGLSVLSSLVLFV